MDREVFLKEFEKLGALEKGDFIMIEEHGASDECSLKGTRNALKHFAFDILKGISDDNREYGVSAYFTDESLVGIVSIEIVELKDGKPVEYIQSFKDRIIGYLLMLLWISFILSAILGLVTIFKLIF
ncbi:hypothetical protein [Peredibacter starrii]|uniref:Uncharacterized protein n=1 Tax=Peredibacter starrii TaxID=28202 RepID=A0AAX4HJZ8_9BACT|nr:hypothetical protein [Peredibacter starrii]WPU63576.1 hypothetical protein SOO65_12840 [Peredibacter starrii]